MKPHEVVIVYCSSPPWTGNPVWRSVQFSCLHAVRVLRDDGFFPHYGKNWMQIGTQTSAYIENYLGEVLHWRDVI
jgi:hypothetical protein